MPYEMSFTDESGTNHPASYWVIQFMNVNDPNKTGGMIFMGYHDVAAFDAGLSAIGLHTYNINDPAVYDFSFGFGRYPQTSAFFQIMEDRALDIDLFFDPADVLSFVKPSSVQVGPAGSSQIVVTFPVQVNSADFTAGVVIEINGVAATLTGAVRSPVDVVTYAITESVGPIDEVTWQYNRTSGVMEDNSSVPLQTFTPIIAENTVGGTLDFSDANNSMWLHIAV